MPLRLTIITGRTLEQGIALEKGKFLSEYADKAALCLLNPSDLEELGATSGSNVNVKTDFGEIVVKATASKEVAKGLAFIPLGPWANIIVDPSTQSTGMPSLKGVEGLVEPTSKKPPSVSELITSKYGKQAKTRIENASPRGNGSLTVTDTVCCFCGCVCDNLEVKVENGRITSVKHACSIGRERLLNHLKDRILKPMLRRGSELIEVGLSEALDEVARILAEAKYPLLYGWSSTYVEAIRAGVRLAEILGGVIDNTSVNCHGPTILGIQHVGTIKATLGQIRNRADLIVYWGCNPLHAHPNHTLRYSAMARGVIVKGRKERKVVLIDVRSSPVSRIADVYIQVKPGMDYELLTALRMLIRDAELEAEEVAGVPKDKLLELADMLMSARFGVIFLGMGLTMTGAKSRNMEEAIRLVQDLNEYTKFVLLAMRGHFNVTGANEVTTWLTGFPYAVDFSRRYPRHNPGVTSSTDILCRGEADAALIIASDPVAHFPQKAVKSLAEIPLIYIGPKWSLTASIADVIIPSAIVGIEVEGTVYRMDSVPLRARKLVEPPEGVLSDSEILEELTGRVLGRVADGAAYR